MTFNWPNIPFQGTEVTAFANAYKELAEAILDDYFNSPIGHLADVVLPYKEKAVVKELLQEGLFYACFIIQQRSGTAGPGTDFVLGNSPIDISDPDLEPTVLRLLGCKWDEMEQSFQNNMKCGKEPPEETEIEDNRCCEQGASLGEGATINSVRAAMGLNPWGDMLAKLMNKYLNCETQVFNENDLDPNDRQKIKEDLQKIIDNRDRYSFDYGYMGGRNGRKKVEDITSSFSSSKLASMCCEPVAKVYSVSTYKPGFFGIPTPGFNGGHYVVGYVDVGVDANGNVICMRDDYDFAYGFEMDRSDGSHQGDPYSGRRPGTHTVDSNGNPLTPEQVCSNHSVALIGCRGRDLAINSFFGCDGGGHNGGGRGTPVPIRVCF